MAVDDLSKLVSLCKRRGFVFQSSEIYGGINSCWDYGPLGVELKRNIKDLWWKEMTCRSDIVGIDSSILMHPRVWEASGHVENFTDPLVDCKKCRQRFREDAIDEKGKCPACGGELTDARSFNLMFKTFMGPVEDAASTVFLRPETAQGIYVNFLNVQTTMRMRVPFGIAQIGKAFRNEITPGNFIFRTREFEQMEMQFFVKPGEDDKWMEYWMNTRMDFYRRHGITEGKLRFHQHGEGELAHYAKVAYDIQYEFPIGWQEFEGIHNRTDFDLKRHMEYSGKNLNYTDEISGEKYIPYIIETSAGCDRFLLVSLVDSYWEDTENERIVMKFHKDLAPVKLAILPLMKKEPLVAYAKEIYDNVYNETDFNMQIDFTGSIGKRYRRQDEIGTPYCVTIDFESLEDKKVTVRDRDLMTQERIPVESLVKYLKDNFRNQN
ncbi:MAG: glycine--tRNA ligase [Oligoflexia bacterium]|nr:glycine--tRNA ligase [Oligoflexia bacterium]